MTREYSMNEAIKIVAQAAADIETWLKLHKHTVEVYNAENYDYYRSIDEDLLWTTTIGVLKIKIKGDR